MIHLKLDVNDIGLLCVVLSDVIESNEFVDNHELQKIHDKLKDSILYKINPDNEKNKNEIEFLKKDSIRKIQEHLKNIKLNIDTIRLDLADNSTPTIPVRLNWINHACNQILNVELNYLKHD